jgi:uncharacterized protein YmfQ (DUF2313 family)
MALMLARWLEALQALLPPGRAFTREPGSVLTRLLSAIAAVLAAVQINIEALAAQSDPRLAVSMLSDWEAMLGLPDSCSVALNQGVLARASLAYQRLTEVGGQSRAYFTSMAQLLGEPGVTISEFSPMHCNDDCNDSLYSQADAFAWRVNIPRAAQSVVQASCNSTCNDFLQAYVPALLECAFQKRKPAHNQVIFAYNA